MKGERVNPEEIDKLFCDLPSQITVEYYCEYTGSMHAQSLGRRRKMTRKGTIAQKVKAGPNSYFVVELEPEARPGKQGRYKQAFFFSDILAGKIKVRGVEG